MSAPAVKTQKRATQLMHAFDEQPMTRLTSSLSSPGPMTVVWYNGTWGRVKGQRQESSANYRWGPKVTCAKAKDGWSSRSGPTLDAMCLQPLQKLCQMKAWRYGLPIKVFRLWQADSLRIY